jgi:hypothetical protein
MGIVGGIALVRELLRQPDDPAPHLLAPAMDKFVSAWRIFRNTRWLLWLYGVLGVIVDSGRAVQGIIQHLYALQRFGSVTMPNGGPTDLAMLSAVPMMVRGTFARFIPMAPSVTDGLSYLLMALVLLLWVLPRVIPVPRSSDRTDNRAFFASCIAIAALACAATAYAYVGITRAILSASNPAPAFVSKFAQLFLFIVGLIATIILDSAMVGGVLGSLLRNKRGERVTSESFWADAQRYFLPLVAIYMIFELFYTIPGIPPLIASLYMYQNRTWPLPGYFNQLETALSLIPVLAVLLMFAPFGIVTKSMSLGQSIRHSVGVWIGRWRQVFPLIALGSFFHVISRFTYLMPTERTTRSWLPVPVAAVAGILGTFMSAWILLAVWEFYTSDVREVVLVE